MKLTLLSQKEINNLFSDKAWDIFLNNIAMDLCASATRILPTGTEEECIEQIGDHHKIEKTTIEHIFLNMAQDCHKNARHTGGGNTPLDFVSEFGGVFTGFDTKCVKINKNRNKDKKATSVKITNEMSLAQKFKDNLDDAFRKLKQDAPNLAKMDLESFKKDGLIQLIDRIIKDKLSEMNEKHGDGVRKEYAISNILIPILIQHDNGLDYSLMVMKSDTPNDGFFAMDTLKLHQSVQAFGRAQGKNKNNDGDSDRLKTIPIRAPLVVGGKIRDDILKVDLYKSKKRIELRLKFSNIPDDYLLHFKTHPKPLLRIAQNNAQNAGKKPSEILRSIADNIETYEKQGIYVFEKQKPKNPPKPKI